MDFRKTGSEIEGWRELVQDCTQWQASILAVMNLNVDAFAKLVLVNRKAMNSLSQFLLQIN
jgi:hypothetical protein